MRQGRFRLVVAAALVAASLGMVACSPPPALTKAQLDAEKLPKKHPKLTDAQKKNCRGCHREAPAIRKQP
ncbi:MAG TPA: hypothetical protein VIL41_01215 [Coriobacteriia bacterium]